MSDVPERKRDRHAKTNKIKNHHWFVKEIFCNECKRSTDIDRGEEVPRIS